MMAGEIYRERTENQVIGDTHFFSFVSTNGLVWTCTAIISPHNELHVQFEFNLRHGRLLEPSSQIKGFHGSITVVYFKQNHDEHRQSFELRLFRDFVTVQGRIRLENVRNHPTCRLRFELELLPISSTEDSRRIYSNFLRDEKKNAILLVDGATLHVNKALLAYHSDFFAKLFESDFLERTMEEIPIRDVSYEDFSSMLCLIHPNPVAPHPNQAEQLLKLADRFLIPAVRHHVESFLITSPLFRPEEKIQMAEIYSLYELLESAVLELNCRSQVEHVARSEEYNEFSSGTKARLLDRLMCFTNKKRNYY